MLLSQGATARAQTEHRTPEMAGAVSASARPQNGGERCTLVKGVNAAKYPVPNQAHDVAVVSRAEGGGEATKGAPVVF